MKLALFLVGAWRYNPLCRVSDVLATAKIGCELVAGEQAFGGVKSRLAQGGWRRKGWALERKQTVILHDCCYKRSFLMIAGKYWGENHA